MDIGDIILPSIALILGVFTSGVFVVWWLQHRNRRSANALILWAIALFLMYWFQVPAILIGFGKVITVTKFNLLFAFTFPMVLLALILVYIGILQISGKKLWKKQKIALSVWFFSALVFFGYHFILNGGIIQTYFLPLGGNIAFYLIIRILIIFALIRLLYRVEMRTLYGVLGASALITEGFLGLARNFFIIDKVLAYPPELWYLHMAQSQFLFITQTMSIILFVIGFYFLHLVYHGRRERNLIQANEGTLKT